MSLCEADYVRLRCRRTSAIDVCEAALSPPFGTKRHRRCIIRLREVLGQTVRLIRLYIRRTAAGARLVCSHVSVSVSVSVTGQQYSCLYSCLYSSLANSLQLTGQHHIHTYGTSAVIQTQ